MKRTTVKTLAAASILALTGSVLAACSSNSSSSGTPRASSSAAAMGKPMVIVNNVGQVFNKTFNPYLTSSLGVTMNMQDLTYEPLLMFNMMQPTQAPIPWLASAYTWSDGGKTLTLTTRPGVKWSDGKPFSAADVAFTFNLLMKTPALSSPAPNPTPLPASATTTGPNTAVLTFSKPQYATLFLIGSTYILPQHIWQGVSNPATYADANPVGTGPYVLSSFSTQKVVFTANPTYWQKSMVHVPEIIFPNYVSNDTSNPALFNGQIDYAGNNVSNVATNYLGKSTDNHTWTSSSPFFADNNVVGLFLNVTKAPLNDVKVRQAISAGISRQQLSVQGETGYEPAATSSSGLMLPTDNALLSQAYANDLPATGNAAKVSQLLTSDGYAKVGGKWMKNGQLIATQLNTLGFEVSFDGVQATQWYIDYPNGHFDAMIHWGAQGPNPYFYFQNWLDNTLSAPIGKTAGGDWERFTSPQAQAALSQFEGTNDTATQQQALNTLQGILSTQAPVIPLLYGAAWYEYNTKNYTGWPTSSNQYMNPVPNAPYLEYTLLHLTPAS